MFLLSVFTFPPAPHLRSNPRILGTSKELETSWIMSGPGALSSHKNDIRNILRYYLFFIIKNICSSSQAVFIRGLLFWALSVLGHAESYVTSAQIPTCTHTSGIFLFHVLKCRKPTDEGKALYSQNSMPRQQLPTSTHREFPKALETKFLFAKYATSEQSGVRRSCRIRKNFICLFLTLSPFQLCDGNLTGIFIPTETIQT